MSADVVDRDHVGVRELGHRLGLAQQSTGAEAVGERLVAMSEQQLDRDFSIQFGIVSRVDLPHPADSEPLEHHVATDDVASHERSRSTVRVGATDLAGIAGLAGQRDEVALLLDHGHPRSLSQADRRNSHACARARMLRGC
jgi:hypothetical protein